MSEIAGIVIRLRSGLLDGCGPGMENAEHPIRELLVAPDFRKPRRRVAGEAIARTRLAVALAQAGREFDRIQNRHVHALTSRPRHQVSGITGEEPAARLHRLPRAIPQTNTIPLSPH